MTAAEKPLILPPIGVDHRMVEKFDPSKLTSAWQGVVKLKFIPRPAELPADFRNDPNDTLIANEINPKRKGWAWRKGYPINFRDPANRHALIHWASHQKWWTNPVIGAWKSQEGWRWSDLYTDLCLQYAEKRISQEEHSFYVRDMICDAIKHSK